MALQTDTQAWRVEIGTRGLMFSNCVPLHLPEGQYHKLRLPVSAYEALAHRFPAIRRWAAIFTLRCHRASDETLFKRAQTLPYPPPPQWGWQSLCLYQGNKTTDLVNRLQVVMFPSKRHRLEDDA